MIPSVQTQTRTYPVGTERIILVASTMSCVMLSLICSTSVNVALREISGKIGATIDEISWVITSYVIANVIMIPLAAMLSDLLGRKRYYTLLIATFTFASLMCGLSTDLWALVFWRFLQGLGGGGLMTTSQSIILDCYPPKKMGQANAIFGLCAVIGPTIGPTLGGYIIDNLAWNWIFFINVPFGVIATFLAWKHVPDMIGAVKPEKIDWLGIGLLILFVGLLQYVLAEGDKKDWFASLEIIVLLVFSLLSLAGFIWRELAINYAVINITLYKNYNIAMGSILMFVTGMILTGSVYIFPVFVQVSLGWTATMTGVFMIPGALAAAVGMVVVGKFSAGINPKILIVTGIMTTFLFLFIMSFSSPNSSAQDFFWAYILRGFGMSLLMIPILTLSVSGLQGKLLAQAAGLTNMLRQLGGAVGVVFINILVNNLNANARAGMIGNFTDYSSACMERISLFTQNFLAAGYPADEAAKAAYKMTDVLLMRQQQLLSYTHAFLGIGLGILACVPIVFLIKYRKIGIQGKGNIQ